MNNLFKMFAKLFRKRRIPKGFIEVTEVSCRKEMNLISIHSISCICKESTGFPVFVFLLSQNDSGGCGCIKVVESYEIIIDKINEAQK